MNQTLWLRLWLRCSQQLVYGHVQIELRKEKSKEIVESHVDSKTVDSESSLGRN